MFTTIILNDLDPGKIRKQFNRTLEQISNGDFVSAEVKKMTGTCYYRAKIDYENRLLFRFGKYNDQTCLLVLEIIFNHEYSKSRFLKGAEVNESRLIAMRSPQEIQTGDTIELTYINHRFLHFHLLDKVLSFDDKQGELLSLPLPQIIIGSAGSGKTALTLEKIKSFAGKVLYITLSPYLAENSSRLFYSYNYENEGLEIEFLSYKEFIETMLIPKEKELDYKLFETWFARYVQATKLKDAHKTFEEFRGVITGLDITKKFLSREDYIARGIKQSIFLAGEREMVYNLFEKYLNYLKENNYYDINILSHQLLEHCIPTYDFIVIDEVQDFTNIQLYIILKSLIKPDNFILCGDANQVVHPNFFSWSHLKTMFYETEIKGDEIKILHTNYRNSQLVSGLANNILKIKNVRFGSIDKESNYLVNTVSKLEGEIVFIENKGSAAEDFGRKTRLSVRYAVLVLRNEDKAKARSIFNTPLLFSVQESKGLEYENIILYNFITDNPAEFNVICENIDRQDLSADELVYSRNRDKSDKAHDIYKFYINSLYVAITRAFKNVYFIEQAKGHKLIRLLGISEDSKKSNIPEEVSTTEEWKLEARRLDLQGKTEQAEAIRKNILVTEKPNWIPMTSELYQIARKDALDPENFNKKAKDRLFDFALVHNQIFIIEQLAELKYKKAEHYHAERNSLFRKYYQYYKDDNLKMIVPILNKYGIDYRDVHNFTPLHASVFSGAVKITESLLRNGANPDLCDTFGKTTVQIALGQAFILPDYAKNKLGKIYPLLLSGSLKIQVNEHLVKIDAHKIEYLLVNLFIAVQLSILQTRQHFESMGVRIDDIINKIQHFPENVLPAYRKRREYLLALLAKHEIESKNPYNKQLFFRTDRGHYILNPEMQILNDNQWEPVMNIMNSYGISVNDIRDHALIKYNKELEEMRKRIEKLTRQRERYKW